MSTPSDCHSKYSDHPVFSSFSTEWNSSLSVDREIAVSPGPYVHPGKDILLDSKRSLPLGSRGGVRTEELMDVS